MNQLEEIHSVCHQVSTALEKELQNLRFNNSFDIIAMVHGHVIRKMVHLSFPLSTLNVCSCNTVSNCVEQVGLPKHMTLANSASWRCFSFCFLSASSVCNSDGFFFHYVCRLFEMRIKKKKRRN